MARVLVTGASGFVGNCLARRLAADGHDVHLILRPVHVRWRLEHEPIQATEHRCDLTDRAAVATAVSDIRPQWVFHLAAHGAYSHQTDAEQILRANVLGTANLAQAAVEAGVEAFVHAGTSSEYGFQDHPPKETEALAPNSVYAVGKAAATLLCQLMARQGPTRMTTLRLYSVYGPYEEPTRLLPTMIVHGLEGRLPRLAEPSIARDFVHVDDVAEAFLLAAARASETPAAVYNIGTGVQTTLRDVVALACELFGIDETPCWGSMANRSWDATCWVADSALARERLGWTPRIGFAEGFERMTEWLRGHPSLLAFYRNRAGLG